MGLSSLQSVAFATPGGESSPPSSGRPIDLVHLARQTLGDRAIEQEVLALFLQQACVVRERIGKATPDERLTLAHALRGSAAGIGAFALADCAARIEKNPAEVAMVPALAACIDAVRDFIASISR